ncbi:hypothetical protein NW760_006049 [Fusarium oxysporum]|nr:hypothetical protein NW758_003793 [Fusarium oxysporum]KAJ4231249.1 hypothetical protein NW760_006049 [Fusarium oxysporum]WKT52707.1 Clr5 domain [Fusarium oxysporum f. sp. vasinfectum]
MASSRLTWVYRRQDRAKDVPKNVLDEYKNIIRHLYLDQNMTRLEVLSYLKDNHGFTLTTSQFAKATKRWGLYKQPRQAQTIVQALEATISPESEPLGAIFDIEVDALGADDENESLFHTVNTLSPDSRIPKNTENDEDSCKEPSQKTGDTLMEAQEGRRKTRGSSSRCHPADVKSPIRISSAPKAQIPLTSRCSTSRILDQKQNTLLICDTTPELYLDYLACCYLFQDSFNCVAGNIHFSGKIAADENLIRQFLDLMRIAKSPSMGQSVINLLRYFHLLEAAEGDADKTSVLPYTSAQDRMLFHAYLSSIYSLIQGRENQAQRHLGRLRQIRDELVASPNCSLSMWSVLHLQQESGQRDTPGDLLEKLDIGDGEFLYSFQMCLRVCKQCLELVEKGVSSHILAQFDSLFRHASDAAISQEISRLMRKESRLDTWQEAGFLFAFVWGNAQQETSISSSWWKQDEISGISPTHFLAIICRMIVHQTTVSHQHLKKEFASEYITKQFISLFYLETIEDLLEADLPTRHFKREFLQHFAKHHTWSELEPEDNGSIKRVQNFQQRVLDNVIRHSMDSAKHHSSVQETSPQATPLQTDVRMTQSLSLGSNKSNNSSSRSTSSSHGRQRYLSSLSNNPTITRSPASGSSRGSSMNSFRRFQAASAAITIRLKDYQGSHMQSLDEQGSST